MNGIVLFLVISTQTQLLAQEGLSDPQWWVSRQRLHVDYGINSYFKKGNAHPCGHGLELVERDRRFSVHNYNQMGVRIVHKTVDEALGGDPQGFPIPETPGVWIIFPDRIVSTAKNVALADALVLVIRSRSGALRVVDLSDGTTFWLHTERIAKRSQPNPEKPQ